MECRSGVRDIIRQFLHGWMSLKPAKIQRISFAWPAARQCVADNQREDKRVESLLVLCLDGGSSPPISTKKESFGTLFSFYWRWADSAASPLSYRGLCPLKPLRRVAPARRSVLQAVFHPLSLSRHLPRGGYAGTCLRFRSARTRVASWLVFFEHVAHSATALKRPVNRADFLLCDLN